MDITVGPLVNLWGFGPDKQPVHIPDDQQIAAARALTGLQHLRVIQGSNGQWLQKDLPGLYVDLSTMGEGFATDHLARLMEQEGINNYLVSVGGAVLSRGMNAQNQPWRVAIQNRPTEKMRFRPESICRAMGSVRRGAIATIMNWTANASPTLLIRPQAGLSITSWFRQP